MRTLSVQLQLPLMTASLQRAMNDMTMTDRRIDMLYSYQATSGGDEEVPPGATSDGSATAGSGPSGSGASGSGGLLARAQRTASSTWLSLSEAEPGSVKHRLYQAGQRLLDSVPPEERLMRGIPTDITKVRRLRCWPRRHSARGGHAVRAAHCALGCLY